MNFISDNEQYDRKSNRLSGYDYTQPGAYFVTICTHKMEYLFGIIKNGMMVENPLGEIVRKEWFRTREIRNQIELLQDEFVIMPNHIHGIIWIMDVGATGSVARSKDFHGPASGSLGAIIGQFKSVTTKRINKYRGLSGKSIWQRSYYDHIIRNEEDYNAIRHYIQMNPQNWESDQILPDNLYK